MALERRADPEHAGLGLSHNVFLGGLEPGIGPPLQNIQAAYDEVLGRDDAEALDRHIEPVWAARGVIDVVGHLLVKVRKEPLVLVGLGRCGSLFLVDVVLVGRHADLRGRGIDLEPGSQVHCLALLELEKEHGRPEVDVLQQNVGAHRLGHKVVGRHEPHLVVRGGNAQEQLGVANYVLLAGPHIDG